MTELVDMQCVPCRGDTLQVTREEMDAYQTQVPEWQIVEVEGEQRLKRAYKFKNFAAPLAFTNLIGSLAEEQDHHPRIVLEWGKVTISWWTHAIGGLHRNDFVMAAKCDQWYAKLIE